MNLVLLGSPGVGKGTIAKMLKEKYGFLHISAGDLIREEIKNKTELGKEFESYTKKGLLAPNELVNKVVKNYIENKTKKDNIILDGYPRTLEQAKALEEFLKIDYVLNLVADDSVIIERLSGRRICPVCGRIYHIKNLPPKVEGKCDYDNANLIQRKDDKPEVIKERLVVYRKQTKPLENYYEEKKLLINIDANDNPEAILKRVEKALNLS